MIEDILPFQKVLDVLLDESKDIPWRYLIEFSDIEPASLTSLLETWPRIEPGRKLLLLDQLNALVNEDTLVSFNDVGRALLRDSDPQVRIRAIRLLVECEDVRLVPIYIDMLTKDSDVDVRAEAASILGIFVQLGEFEDIPDDVHHQIEDVLLKVLNGEDDPIVRRQALEALGFSSRMEVPVLIESSFNRQDPVWKASAIFAMGRSNDKRWADHVLHMIVSEDRRIRLAAVQASGELGLALARPILLRLLEEEFDDAIAGAAIWSLSQIGGEDVRIYLQNLLDNVEDDDQAAFLEEALDNLAFTEDMASFDLLALDADDLDELDLEE
ncbi:MAG: HEAT repeat domain-containing protein [Anaerolineales bacterium]|nr:HEAT repeat domain-containing protein [Anaerolineales bacterium]